MASSSQNRGTWRVPGGSARPWRKCISASVLTAALVEPPPVAAKALTADGARHAVMDVDGHLVARLMFGGVGATNKVINWQAILWSETSNLLNTEAWIGRVVANGTATLGDGTSTYTVAGLGTTTNSFADTITDTKGYSRIYSPADETVALIEFPLFNAQRVEIQTDLPGSNPVTSADVFIQLGEKSTMGNAENLGNVGLLNAAETEINPATSDLQTALNTLLGVGTGAMASAQAVTLATDDTQLGAVGAAADVDGNIHGQLRAIGEGVGDWSLYTTERVALNFAAGRATIKALVSGKVIYLRRLRSSADALSTLKIAYDDDGAGTSEVVISAVHDVPANGGAPPISEDIRDCCLQTASGKQLTVVTTGGAFNIDAVISYLT